MAEAAVFRLTLVSAKETIFRKLTVLPRQMGPLGGDNLYPRTGKRAAVTLLLLGF